VGNWKVIRIGEKHKGTKRSLESCENLKKRHKKVKALWGDLRVTRGVPAPGRAVWKVDRDRRTPWGGKRFGKKNPGGCEVRMIKGSKTVDPQTRSRKEGGRDNGVPADQEKRGACLGLRWKKGRLMGAQSTRRKTDSPSAISRTKERATKKKKSPKRGAESSTGTRIT